MFVNRKDAGEQLAKALFVYARSDSLVLSIPRGGVEVGFYVAGKLELPLSLVMVRKLPFPDNPEAGFGAIAEDGSIYFQSAVRSIPHEVTDRIRVEQMQEIQRRIKMLRGGHLLPPISGKTVIIVDDGIAMGSTMLAAIRFCKQQKAGKIVAAAPVGSPSAVRKIQEGADEVIVLQSPAHFHAVADYYQHWYDVQDEEVLQILQERPGCKQLIGHAAQPLKSGF